MKTKMISIPFDLERAKRISEKLEEGKIVTRDDHDVRIICWDKKGGYFPILALVLFVEENYDGCYNYTENGHFFEDGTPHHLDLFLQVPEYTQYKDGDVLVENGNPCPFIFKDYDKEDGGCNYYVGIGSKNNLKFSEGNIWCHKQYIKGYADEGQKQKLINALQDSKESLAKEYLKKFFNIEFNPFDQVLVRDKDTDIWTIDIFKIYFPDTNLYYCMTGEWEQCIPYNEDTKHLFNTDKPYINA